MIHSLVVGVALRNAVEKKQEEKQQEQQEEEHYA
jgi:hypothetical protein